MPSYSRNEIVLVRFPFSNLSSAKIRPAVVVNGPHLSEDLFLVPLTSKTNRLLPGEFVLTDWTAAGLNVISAVKRGIFTIHESLVIKSIGTLTASDIAELDESLRNWLML